MGFINLFCSFFYEYFAPNGAKNPLGFIEIEFKVRDEFPLGPK
jgi:hypothetical protein